MPNLHLTNSLISVTSLAENLSADNLILFSANMKPIVPPANPVPQTPVYIPGSLRFDFDDVLCDHTTDLPHMMPSADFFETEMQACGVNHDSAIVVYDQNGIYSSPRAWWMFKAMGHAQVAVLDGGLPAWLDAGYETTVTLATPKRRGNFASQPQGQLIVDSQTVLHALSDSAVSVVDARSAGRFTGQEKEPRAGLRGGHMPGALNIPFTQVLTAGKLSAPSALQAIFAQYQDKKLIFSCGSGVTACVLALAAEQAGLTDLAVYDGSWSEWGQTDSGLPVNK